MSLINSEQKPNHRFVKEIQRAEKELVELNMLIKKKHKALFMANQQLKDINAELGHSTKLLTQREQELDNAYATVVHQQEQLELITNHSPIGITYVDHDLRYTFVNSIYQEWLNVPMFEVLGQRMENIWEKKSADFFVNQMDLLGEERRRRIETALLFPNGDYKYIILTLCPEYNKEGKLIGCFHFIEDITHLKEAEIVLKKNNQQLENEVVERKKVTKELELANEQLKHFAYAVAHDLKEPVRTINSFSKILVKKYEQTMPPDGKSLLNLITSSSNRLGTMIQDLLSYATMDKNLLKASEVKLNDVVEIVKSQLQAAIDENEVVLNCNNLGIVKGHQTLMIQLFQNIISNAIKFKTSKESPIINIASEKMGDFYQISIQDNGIGIAENHIDHIFGVFNKLHAPTEYSGSGIGLATCKKIVDIYEGKIWATSELGKGTMFYFTLPAFTN